MVTEGFDGVVSWLQAECDEALFAQGSQLVVSRGGETLLDWAGGVEGLGRPVEPDTLFAVYCAGKPMFGVALAILLDEGEVSLDDRLRHLLPGGVSGPLADLTVADLVTHTAGVHRLSAYDYLLHGSGHRHDAVMALAPPAGWRPGHHAGYSEAAAWHLLSLVVEELVDEPAPGFLRREVLEPLGATDVFPVMTDDEFRANARRIGVNSSMREMDPLPMLFERSREMCTTWKPGFGTYATCRGLASFYRGVLGALAGERALRCSVGMLRSCVTPQRPSVHDVVLDRPCSFGIGFMVRLEEHEYGSHCSEAAFGHSGNVGMTAAMADPDHDLVVAFHSNGLLDSETSLAFRRPQLLARVYAAAVGGPGTE